jgi:hypothetical protein
VFFYALGADDDAVAKRLDGAEHRFGSAWQVLVEHDVAGLVEDTEVHGPGVQVDPAVE